MQRQHEKKRHTREQPRNGIIGTRRRRLRTVALSEIGCRHNCFANPSNKVAIRKLTG